MRLAVQGAGRVGKRHIEHVANEDCADLVAIFASSPDTEPLADRMDVAWYPTFAAMAHEDEPEGVIMATLNQMHVGNSLEAVDAGVAVLIEKPIAEDVAAATRPVEAAEQAGVLLVGHHRRYNLLVQDAKRAIDCSRIGQMVAVHGRCWFYKLDDYFDVAWRREKRAGPIFLNLIHDVDLLRYLGGDVMQVQAIEFNARRRNAVEDTAVILLKFAGGTLGSLSVPCLELWRHTGKPSWQAPIACERLPVAARASLGLQVQHFCGVIRGPAQPVVSGREGLSPLKAMTAVEEAAATGGAIDVD